MEQEALSVIDEYPEARFTLLNGKITPYGACYNPIRKFLSKVFDVIYSEKSFHKKQFLKYAAKNPHPVLECDNPDNATNELRQILKENRYYYLNILVKFAIITVVLANEDFPFYWLSEAAIGITLFCKEEIQALINANKVLKKIDKDQIKYIRHANTPNSPDIEGAQKIQIG